MIAQMVEKDLEDLIKDIGKKRAQISDALILYTEDKRTNRVARAEKELTFLLKLAQEWNKKLYNIDRFIKENITACLLSSNEDIRKRAQHFQRRKKKGKK